MQPQQRQMLPGLVARDQDGGTHFAACSSSALGFRAAAVRLAFRRARARRAASCSACFLVVPRPLAMGLPGSLSLGFNLTSTRNRLWWSGPLSLFTLYTGIPACTACKCSCNADL